MIRPTRSQVKFVKRTADFANPEKELEPEFDDRSGKKRVYGPVEFAIDGKDDTAWGIDAGPGRRNQPRKAVFLPDKPIAFPHGAILTFKLKQNHGGWNSDDNQNHNLGRFRLSRHRRDERRGGSGARRRARDFQDSARRNARPPKSPRFSVTGERPFPSSKRRTKD